MSAFNTFTVAVIADSDFRVVWLRASIWPRSSLLLSAVNEQVHSLTHPLTHSLTHEGSTHEGSTHSLTHTHSRRKHSLLVEVVVAVVAVVEWLS